MSNEEGRPVIDPTFVRFVKAHVQPVARRAGFHWSQVTTGSSPRHGQEDAVLFHADDEEEFGRRYPQFWPNTGGLEVLCIDLWVHRSLEDGTVRADVEGHDVARWLEENGSADLQASLEEASDLDIQLRVLASALEVMLELGG